MDVFHLITLKDTPHRKVGATNLLSKMGLNYQVHEFEKHSVPWKGCISSHISLYKYAQKNDMDYIYICEDNISQGSGNPETDYGPLQEFLAINTSWNIVFLGGYILRPWDYCEKTIYKNIYETRNNNHGTVAYVIHRRLYEKVIDIYEKKGINVHFDIFLYNFKCFLYRPFLFYHAHNLTSNINKKSDYWRRIWFHPVISRIKETVFFDRIYLYILLVICVAFVFYLIFL